MCNECIDFLMNWLLEAVQKAIKNWKKFVPIREQNIIFVLQMFGQQILAARNICWKS